MCMRVCPSLPVPTVHSIDFKLGGGIAEDPRECSVECEFGWMSDSGGTRSEQVLHWWD